MDNFDKQRLENALWTLLQYKDDLIDIAEDSEFISSMCMKDCLKMLKAIKEELKSGIKRNVSSYEERGLCDCST